MAFTTNLTGTVQIDDSIREEYDVEFRLALAEQGVGAEMATVKKEFGAKSIQMPKYDQLELATTPLTETEDVVSEALNDTSVLLTPQEYGKVVTTTKLANIQSGGMVDRAAARLVGINAGRTRNRLALMAMDSSSNVLFGGDATDEASIDPTDILDGTLMGKVYNKLNRENAMGVANGSFVMIAHDDVIHDIRESSDWQDAHRYAMPQELLRNEVGMYKGFRVIRDNLSTIADNGTAKVYSSYFVGFNALGEAISNPISMVATGPFDKLNRFVNMGHYGIYTFGIVEQKALWIAKTASSVAV